MASLSSQGGAIPDSIATSEKRWPKDVIASCRSACGEPLPSLTPLMTTQGREDGPDRSDI
jgi:hypothetical protein